MPTLLSNLTAKWTNSSQTYNAISMNVTAQSYDSKSTILTLKLDGNTKFAVGPNNYSVLSGSLVLSNLSSNGIISNTISSNSIITNIITANTLNVSGVGGSSANIIALDASTVNARTVNTSSILVKGGPVPVSNGGTGLSSTTAYSLLAGGTTTTGNFQSLSGLGTAGQVLKSLGAAALPSWDTIIKYLGAISTTSGSSASLSNLVLTPYKILVFDVDGVSFNGSYALRLGGVQLSELSGSAAGAINGLIILFLDSGNAIGLVGITAVTGYVGVTGYTTLSTSIDFTPTAGNFDAGIIRVYGI